jgi:hypothetical protein
MTCTSKPTNSSPSLDLHGAFQAQLVHLTRLAAIPAWKAWAWHRAKELDVDPSGLFTGMAEAVKAAMTGQGVAKASEAPTSTKAP